MPQFRVQRSNTHFFFSKFMQPFFYLKQNSNNFFLTQSLKDTKNKNNNKNTNVTRTRTKQRHKQECNKMQTRKQITEHGQNTNLDKLQRKNNRIG